MLNVLGQDQFVFFLDSFVCHSTCSLDSGLIYFIKDFPRGIDRIISRCDWPSDDQKICARENSFCRLHDTVLVIERSACRPNSGCENNEACIFDRASDVSDFERRGYHAVQTRRLAKLREVDHLVFQFPIYADFYQRILSVAGQNCDAQDQWARYPLTLRGFSHSFIYGAHHFRPAHRVNIKNANAQARGLDSRHSDSIRDVMKFQIQKDMLAHRDDLSYNLGAGGGEELLADLEHPGDAAQTLDQGQSLIGRSDV